MIVVTWLVSDYNFRTAISELPYDHQRVQGWCCNFRSSLVWRIEECGENIGVFNCVVLSCRTSRAGVVVGSLVSEVLFRQGLGAMFGDVGCPDGDFPEYCRPRPPFLISQPFHETRKKHTPTHHLTKHQRAVSSW